MQTQYVNPKLLFEFYKNQKVPPLVKKYQYQTHFAQSIIRSRKTSMTVQQKSNVQQRENEIQELKHDISMQIEQNRQLRLIIKQLEQKMLNLVDVNQRLCSRTEQLQNKNKYLVDNSQKIKKNITRTIKIQTFHQIQQYLKIQAHKFTTALLQIKMTPLLENKIDSFLQQIININELSIKQALNQHNDAVIIQDGPIFDEIKVNTNIKDIIRSLSKSRSKSKSIQKNYGKIVNASGYDVIFEKLNVENSGRPGAIVNRATSPQKFKSGRRAKIFTQQDNYAPNFVSAEQVGRKLDF